MPVKGLSYGLNLAKNPGAKSQPPKRKPIFDDDESSGEDNRTDNGGFEEIGEFDGVPTKKGPPNQVRKPIASGVPPKLGTGRKKAAITMYGDLSETFTSKKYADTAAELDANIYDYDAVYDSLKPKKKVSLEEQGRKPKYMTNLIAAAAVRKRDASIAEEKKLARDREAEGEEFADKEKFVTSAYKKQQEENRQIEKEERIREEQEAKMNSGTGMSSFYKNMLERGERNHAEVVKAVEESIKEGPVLEEEGEKQKTDVDIAREINAKKAGAILVNDEGQVVDKRQLLKSGLNVAAKPKPPSASAHRHGISVSDRSRGSEFVGAGGGKQAMRERQSRMMEEQLLEATKRAREEEEDEKLKVESAAKSRKTEGDISSAKERYLARKRQAEEAKKN
ncbi:putative nuclear speckle splicing regulatory protein 1 like protein [Calycina marina]|uniref:Nuclear speckle splicing regulatory protein 1 like protein n=1 Tax=Calycina marina TaxID=1763456 RepID=A0A9P7Z7W6_9HELO|nr:putative nuclear speckle splicing regulatory protein 1 like protein [Calycina marina]